MTHPPARRSLIGDYWSGVAALVILALLAEAYFGALPAAGVGPYDQIKVKLLAGLIVVPLVLVGIAVMFTPSFRTASANLAVCWSLFGVYVAALGFTRYGGLAKDLERTVGNFALLTAGYWLMAAPVFALQAAVLWWWHRHLWKPAPKPDRA